MLHSPACSLLRLSVAFFNLLDLIWMWSVLSRWVTAVIAGVWLLAMQKFSTSVGFSFWWCHLCDRLHELKTRTASRPSHTVHRLGHEDSRNPQQAIWYQNLQGCHARLIFTSCIRTAEINFHGLIFHFTAPPNTCEFTNCDAHDTRCMQVKFNWQ
jgi:hypothetical protein